MTHKCGICNGGNIHVPHDMLVELPPQNGIAEDITTFPIGISPTGGCGFCSLLKEQERHFCKTVIFVPVLELTVLSHSDLQRGQN